MFYVFFFFFFNDTATTEIYTVPYTLSLHDALPISFARVLCRGRLHGRILARRRGRGVNYFSDFAGTDREVVPSEDVLAGADARDAEAAAVCAPCFTAPYFAASHCRTSAGL